MVAVIYYKEIFSLSPFKENILKGGREVKGLLIQKFSQSGSD